MVEISKNALYLALGGVASCSILTSGALVVGSFLPTEVIEYANRSQVLYMDLGRGISGNRGGDDSEDASYIPPVPHPQEGFSYIVYGVGSLWEFNERTKEQSRIFNLPSADLITPSPNGSWFFYANIGNTNGDYYAPHIRLRDGSEDRKISSMSSILGSFPSWSPDGNKLALSLRQGLEYKIFIYDVESEELKAVSTPEDPEDHSHPRFSPSGNNLLYRASVSSGGNDSIKIFNTRTGRTRSTVDYGRIINIEWLSEDTFLFAGQEDGANDSSPIKAFIFNTKDSSAREVLISLPPTVDYYKDFIPNQ